LVAIGNKFGKVFLFSLSGNEYAKTSASNGHGGHNTSNRNSSSQTGSIMDIDREIEKFHTDEGVDKAKLMAELRSQVSSALLSCIELSGC
jgi:hypothetical protein